MPAPIEDGATVKLVVTVVVNRHGVAAACAGAEMTSSDASTNSGTTARAARRTETDMPPPLRSPDPASVQRLGVIVLNLRESAAMRAASDLQHPLRIVAS